MRALLVLTAVLVAVVACNGVLGIPKATLLVDDAGDVTSPPPDDSGCPEGQKSCNGACVATDDVAMGCGADDCTPCGSQATNTTYTCSNGKCAIAACADGFKDCNDGPDDGCETDIENETTSCGGCGKKCGQGLRCETGVCRCSDGPSCGFGGACDDEKVCSCGGAGTCSPGAGCTDDDTCAF